MKIGIVRCACMFACLLLFGAMTTVTAAGGDYRYAIVIGPAESIDGFSPSSLNETGEVVYADNVNGVIATSTDILARVGDIIDGELLGDIRAGAGTSINDDGLAVFRARYGVGDFDAIFTPSTVVAKQWDDLTGMTLGFVGHPSINDSGRIVYEATLCPNMSCFASAIFIDRIELLRTPLSDGFVELSGLGDPVINDAGVTALYGYAYLADTSGVYLLPNNGPLARIVHTGESLGPGIILDNPRGILKGLDLNEHGDVATCWNTEAGDWVVLKNAEVLAKAGDVIDGITLTGVPNHRPAINDEGTVAFIADYAGGRGVFTQTDVVLTEGQTFGSEAIRFLIGLAINDSGVIAAHVGFESGFDGIVLATSPATNFYVEMQTGSTVGLRQTVDVPSDPFAVRLDHRFTTTDGQLSVRLGGVFLGSVSAPSTVGEEQERATFDVSGGLLGQSDAIFELELDGPTGSTLELDNVYLPGLVNGTFQSGGLAGWEVVTSGVGSVEVVPEPSVVLASLTSLMCVGVILFARGKEIPAHGRDVVRRV